MTLSLDDAHVTRTVGSELRGRSYRHRSLADRFWEKVRRGDGCWFWGGARDPQGYGQIRLAGKRGRLLKAHRVSWVLANGPLADGLVILHTCDTPQCVRPDHLIAGTPSDNSRDAASKGRLVFQKHPERCPRGERHASAKLTANQVREVRALRAVGWTQTRLAARFGVTQAAIWYLLKGRTWRSVKRTDGPAIRAADLLFED